jgi:hypothetical protein
MAAPQLPEHLMEAILLLLPPDDRSCLLHTSLLGKPWACAVTRPDLLRLLRARHGAPPLLGFLHNSGDPRFIPTAASAFSPRAPDRSSWRALDFCHGRALFISVAVDAEKGVRDLLVWEPTTGRQRRVPAPGGLKSDFSNGAVLCAVDGCDHLHCRRGPFRVVFVSFDAALPRSETSACVYSSEADTWGEPVTIRGVSLDFNQPGVLLGNSRLYFMSDVGFAIEYDLANNRLDLYDTPHNVEDFRLHDRFVFMLGENGGRIFDT